MAKFLPIIGEIYTAVESAVLITSAGLAEVCGDKASAEKLAVSAGNAWKEYTETNLLATPIKGIVLDSQGKREESKQLEEKYLNSMSSFADAIPVVGHVKGCVHYAMGDTDAGNKSMEASTRTTAVLGAGIATGGLGGGLALGAGVGVGTGVAYDGTATLIDGAVNGDKASLHGTMKLAEPEKMNPNEFVGGVMGIVGDAMTGASGASMGKSLRNTAKAKQVTKNSGQSDLQSAYKESKVLKDAGVDHRTATKQTMETAQQSKAAQAKLSRETNYATSKVVDKATNESGVGHSGKYSRQMRLDNGMSKNAARRGHNYNEPSNLQNRNTGVKQVSNRPQRACAEHGAFDQLNAKNPHYEAKNVNTSTVFKKADGIHVTKHRCVNCNAYGEAMGKVITDYIADETPVPDCGYVDDGYNVARLAKSGAAGVVTAKRR